MSLLLGYTLVHLSLVGPPQPPPATAQIVIQGSAIELPHLPERINQAHSEIGQVLPKLRQNLLDLEQNLMDLYSDPAWARELPERLKVPKESTEQVQFLLQVLHDEQFAELEKKVMDDWEAWQSALVEQGLAARSAASPAPATGASSESRTPAAEQEKKELQKRREGMRKSAAMLEAEKGLRIQMTTLGSAGASGGNPRSGFGPENPSSLAMGAHAAEVEERLLTTRSAQMVHARKAPLLASHWVPFAAHMNDYAQRLNDLEKASPLDLNPDLRLLKARTKMEFLERYRSALWFCWVVWARMADAKPPAPLRELHRP